MRPPTRAPPARISYARVLVSNMLRVRPEAFRVRFSHLFDAPIVRPLPNRSGVCMLHCGIAVPATQSAPAVPDRPSATLNSLNSAAEADQRVNDRLQWRVPRDRGSAWSIVQIGAINIWPRGVGLSRRKRGRVKTLLRKLLLWCLLGSAVAASAGGADSSAMLSAGIAPRPLTEALEAFGRQTGLQLIYVSEIAEAQQSKGARAGLTASAALTQLLDGTGLAFEFLNARTVRIFPASTVVPTLSASSAPPPQSPEWRAPSRALGLEEVVVTGTRGPEPVSKVPIDMMVWTERALEASHVKEIAQLAVLTPGVDFGFSPIAGDAYTDLVIRGVTSRHGTAVGLYLDDSPILPSRAATYTRAFPLTFDLERVEILRGPQTVLLGDHAMSGAIRFIPNRPSLTTTTGLFRAEVGVNEYGSTSYEAGAAAGGPLLTDVLGFRVSGWFREDGGYVNRVDPLNTNIVLDKDSNRILNKVVRGALTFAPTANVQITPSLTYQSTYIHDPSEFFTTLSDPARGDFRDAVLLQQPWTESYYLASVKLTAALGAAELSAVTSYFDHTISWFATDILQPANVTEATAWTMYGLDQRTFLADLRLTSVDPNAWLTWTAGTFASKDQSRHPYHGTALTSDATVTDQTQLAGFGQVALRVTQRLTTSVGARIGHSNYDTVTEDPPVFHANNSDTWTAPRFGLSWQGDERNLVYLTVAKGYGSAGVYPQTPAVYLPCCTADPGSPTPYPPDTLWSYEIGSKHKLMDGGLRLETSIFHVTWNNGPADFAFVSTEHNPVPGSAVSNGVGLTAEALISDRARLALDIAYTDAHYTQTVTLPDGTLFVTKGTSLPVSPWNLTASLERDVQLPANVTASVRIEDVFRSAPGATYLDSLSSVYATSGPPDPSINILNLRATAKWSDFELAAFLGNVLDARPILSGRSGGAPQIGGPMATTLIPRTLSVSASWRF